MSRDSLLCRTPTRGLTSKTEDSLESEVVSKVSKKENLTGVSPVLVTRTVRYTDLSTWHAGKSSRVSPKLTFGIKVSSPGGKVFL